MNTELVQQQIKEVEAKLSEMKAELVKLEEFKWKYKYYSPYLQHTRVEEGTGCSESLIYHGRYRIKKDNAERALERNRVANRLEALAEQLEPDWVANWSDKGQNKGYVYYCEGEYTYYSTSFAHNIGQVYMSVTTAKKIVDMLNNKEIVL